METLLGELEQAWDSTAQLNAVPQNSLREFTSFWEGASDAYFSLGHPGGWSKRGCLHLAVRTPGPP